MSEMLHSLACPNGTKVHSHNYQLRTLYTGAAGVIVIQLDIESHSYIVVMLVVRSINHVKVNARGRYVC